MESTELVLLEDEVESGTEHSNDDNVVWSGIPYINKLGTDSNDSGGRA